MKKFKCKKYPSQEELKKYFKYEDGHLIYIYDGKYSRKNKKLTKVGFSDHQGYIKITYMGEVYMAHRIIWILLKGNVSRNQEIDHIDGNRSNNKIENLRLVEEYQNHWNMKGTKGYTWNKQLNSWHSMIYVNGKKCFLGLFDNEKDAKFAYDFGKSKLHDFSKRLDEIDVSAESLKKLREEIKTELDMLI